MEKEVFNSKVLPLLLVSIFVMLIGSVAGLATLMLGEMILAFFVGALIVEIALIFAIRHFERSFPLNIALLMLFTFISGMMLTPLFLVSLSENLFVVPLALFMTSLVVGGLSAYVYFTNKDFRSWGPALLFMLIGAIIVSIVGWFLNFTLLDMVMDAAIIVIFMGFVLYDTSRIMRDYGNDRYVSAVLSLYLDFVNILVRMISLMSGGRRR